MSKHKGGSSQVKHTSYKALTRICKRLYVKHMQHLTIFSIFSSILGLTLTMNQTFVFTGDEETPPFILRKTARGVYCSELIYSTWRSLAALRSNRWPSYINSIKQTRLHSEKDRTVHIFTYKTWTKWRKVSDHENNSYYYLKKPIFPPKSSVNHNIVIYRLYTRGPDQYWHFYVAACLHTV